MLRSVLGGRRRGGSGRALRFLTGSSGSFWANPGTLLTAAGVAWGIYETMQHSQGSTGSGGSTGSVGSTGAVGSTGSTGSTPPLPDVGGPGAVSADALRIVRLAISAANADGTVSDVERAAILDQARTAGVGDIVEQEMRQPRPLAEIVAGVSDTAQRATLYVLAFSMVRGDEQPGGAERIYLAQLANRLGLDPQTVQQLERNAASRIDAQP
ncbi:MAG TPA: DUF533 domain-containing protein [Vicinamibacterales bacterium]|nr:DUF533 domain-containing protein [Vicinamibacterales bacterium]